MIVENVLFSIGKKCAIVRRPLKNSGEKNLQLVDFYFDFLSPYSYLATLNWERNQKRLIELDAKFLAKPVFMAQIIRHHGGLGPAEIGVKRNYLFKDILRYAKLNDFPFYPPQEMPFNSLFALRLIAGLDPAAQMETTLRIFKKIWGEGKTLDCAEHIHSELGLENPDVIAQGKLAKQIVKENTQRAIKKGLFGVPSFLVGDELFWGNDSWKYLLMNLEGKDPLNRAAFQEIIDTRKFYF